MQALAKAVSGFDPLDWWIAGLVVSGLVLGVTTGFFRARKIQPRGFKWRFFRHELLWTVINVTVSAFTLGGMKTWLVARGYIAYNAAPASVGTILLEYAAYFIAFDTWFYWGHRLMHVPAVYKWTHKTHHVSTSTNPLTSTSVNPVEAFIDGAAVPMFMVFMTFLAGRFPLISPIHSTTIAFIAPTAVLMGFYVHSGFELLPSWWNRSWATKWFITATFHDQHHRFFTGNYGGYTTVWDRLCGTMRKNYEPDFHKITTRPIERKPQSQTPEAAAA